MVCWMIEVSERTAESKSALVRIQEDGERRARLVLRALLKSSKSMLWKSWVGGLSVHGIMRSMVTTMGRWSAFGGWICGAVVQEVMRLKA